MRIPINANELENVLETRIRQGKGSLKLSDFFLVIRSPVEGEIEREFTLQLPELDQKESEFYQEPIWVNRVMTFKMRVFFVKDAPHHAVCCSKFMKYPKVSKVKGIKVWSDARTTEEIVKEAVDKHVSNLIH